MQRNIIYISILIILILLGTTLFFTSEKLGIPKKIHYHAGFVVFQNNKKLDFSDTKYMSIEPCVPNQKEDNSPNTIQIEKAHLHDNNGELVHIEREGAMWKDLFTNIHFPIAYANTRGFINGKLLSNYQNQPIHPYDSLVVFIGKNDPKHLQEAVTKDDIKAMEKNSVDCGG